MGREIEIKIPLTSAEFDRLYDFICLKQSIVGITIIGDAEKTGKTSKSSDTDSDMSENLTSEEVKINEILCYLNLLIEEIENE